MDTREGPGEQGRPVASPAGMACLLGEAERKEPCAPFLFGCSHGLRVRIYRLGDGRLATELRYDVRWPRGESHRRYAVHEGAHEAWAWLTSESDPHFREVVARAWWRAAANRQIVRAARS